jgi:hypothetical protein
MSDYVTIGHFLSLTEAEAVHAMLEGAGLHPETRDEQMAQLDWLYVPALGGVRVEVPGEEVIEAQELLRRPFDSGPVLSDEDRAYFKKKIRIRRGMGVLAIFLMLGPILGVLALILALWKRPQISQ